MVLVIGLFIIYFSRTADVFLHPLVLGESDEEIRPLARDNDICAANDVKNRSVDHDGRISVEYTCRYISRRSERASEQEPGDCDDEFPGA